MEENEEVEAEENEHEAASVEGEEGEAGGVIFMEGDMISYGKKEQGEI